MIYFKLIAFAAVVLSCDDYLNTLPGDKYDDATIWQNTNLIDSYVFGIYKGVPYPFNWYVSASLVDEAVPIQNDGVMTRVLTSHHDTRGAGRICTKLGFCHGRMVVGLCMEKYPGMQPVF